MLRKTDKKQPDAALEYLESLNSVFVLEPQNFLMIGLNGAAELVFGCWNSGGDDELLVRASAVLTSQERRKMVPWETRSPLGAYKLALCPGHIMRENPWEKRSWGGVI